ncbi:beta strand repeat-containing protein [Algoriphagus antarcticus]|uniref:Putative Ig domain-containing protein n=1 Tax=Algoriphagus antarcticus TaxID=238540 RepID=A0A3E0DV81_9BACT|nr:PKD-like domain-containing protein [Algoriphagus antarcticus]REG88497.1 putative Ig domain-containing protein [Algoriphagus antarcticus]
MPFKETPNFHFSLFFTRFLAIRRLGMILFLIFGWGVSEGFGQIAFRGSSTNTSNGGSIIITAPATLQVGDLMIVNIAESDNDGATLGQGGYLAGWTTIASGVFASAGNDRWAVAWLYKIADAGDVANRNFGFDADNQAESIVGGIATFSGVDSSNPFDVIGNPYVGTGDDVISDEISPTVAGNALVMLAAIADNTTYADDGWNTNTPGPGVLQLTEIFEQTSTTSANLSVGAAWVLNPNTGNTGDGDAEMNGSQNDTYASILLALRPCNTTTGMLSGAQTICAGGTTTFTSTLSGGSWSTSSAAIATINSSTGVITGVSAGTASMTYTVTGTGGCANGTTTRTVTVTAPPSSLSYTINSPTYCAGQTITANSATSGGGAATSFSVSPALPAGLTFNTTTGQITGTPTTTVGLPAANYTVRATNSCGFTERVLNITITPAAPTGLSYTANGPLTYCASQPITPNNASTSGGGAATSFSVSPALPAGLTLNTTTGQITGTPTTVAGVATANYVVRATNSCGFNERTLNIRITPAAPTGLSYTSNGPLAYCVGQAITPNSTSTSGGGAATSFSVSPALPAGLTFNTTTGQITGTPTTTGGVPAANYTVTASNSCGSTTRVLNIRISTNTLTLTSAPATTAQIVCINTPITPITYATTNATGATFANLPLGVTGSWAGNVVTISGTPTEAKPALAYTVILTGGCETITTVGTIAVNPDNTITRTSAAATTAQTVCIDTPITPITYSTTDATGAIFTNLPTGVTGSWAGNVVTISGTPTVAGAALTYTVTLTGGCGAIITTGSIAVTPNNTLTLTSAAATSTQAVCINTAIVPITYMTTGATNAAVTNLPAGVTGTWAGDVVTISGTPTVAGAARTYTVTLTGGCSTSTTTGTIAVNPDPTINVGGALAAICQGATSAQMGGSVGGSATGGTWSGGAGTWTNANNPATATYTAGAGESGSITLTLTSSGGSCGTTFVTKTVTVNQTPTANEGAALAAICQAATSAAMGGNVGGGATGGTWSGGAGTWTNPTNPATATYTAGATESGSITLTLTTSGGSCGTTFITKTIAVNQNPTATVGPALAAICQGDTSAAMGGSIGGGTSGGTWSGGTGTWTNPTNPSSATYTAGASESGSITLTLTTSGGSCGTVNTTKTITVNPNPTANAGGDLAAICQSATSAAMGGSVGGGATGGTWSGGAGTWINATNPATATYTAGATESGSITLTLTSSGGSCGTVTAIKTIRVNPNPTANAGAALAAICQGGTSSAMGGSIGGGATGGTWSGGAGIWTNATNPATATYTAGISESGPITLTLTTSGGSCGTTFVTKTITVNQTPTANAGPDLAAICQGAASAAMGGSVGGGATSGTWSGGAGIWTNANNPSTATYTAGATESGSITLTLTTSGGSCGTTTATKTIIVNPTPAISNMITSVCTDGTFTIIPVNGTDGNVPAGTTYSWSAPVVTGGMTGGAAGSSATSISGTLRNTNNGAQTATYTVTPTTGSCTGTPFTVIITVNVATAINFPPDNTNRFKCFGDGFPPLSVGAIGGDLTYQWFSNTTQSNIGGTLIAGAESVSYAPPSAIEGITYYYVVVTGSCGTQTSAPSGEYTVNPSKTLITVDPSDVDQTVCLGDTFTTISALASGEGTINYQWYSNSNPTNSGGILIPGEINEDYTPLASSVGTSYYYVLASSDCGTVSTAVSGAFTVDPKPQINDMTDAVCSEAGFTVSPVDGTNGVVPAGTTYSWAIPAVSGGLSGGASGSGNSITGTLTNSTNTTQTATYTVTPITGTCPGATFTVTVTVDPKAAISNMTDMICSGEGFASTPGNGTNGLIPAGTTYSWPAPVVTGGLTGRASGSGESSITGILSNPTNIAQTATYTITPLSGSCAGPTFTLTVTVSPKPAITASTSSVCGDAAFTATPANGTNGVVPAGTTYAWLAPTVTGGLIGGTASIGSPTSITGTLSNPTNTAQTATYTVIPTSGSCKGPAFTVTVTVSPRPAVTNMVNAVCSGSGFTTTPINSTNGIVPAGTTYSWPAPVVTGSLTGGAASSSSPTSITGTLTNPTTSPQTATYTVTPITSSCAGTTFTVTVTVNPTPVLNSTLTPAAICSNSAFNYTPTSLTSGTAFTWTRAAVTGISNAAVTVAQSSNPNETLINTTASPVDVVYAYTITANGCSNTQNVTVRVNPIPTLNSTLTPVAICSNSAFTYTPSSLTSGATFTWTRAAVTGISNAAVTTAQSTNPNEILINTTANPVSVVYSYTTTANGCSNTQNVTVSVSPRPVVSNRTAAICSGSEFTISPANGSPTSATIVPTGTTYTWTVVDNPNVTGDLARGTPPTNISQTLVNTSAVIQTVTYTITPSVGGCTGPSFTATVTVNPTPILSSATAVTRCTNLSTSYTAISTTPSTTFSWTRAVAAGISNGAGSGASATANENLINTTANPVNVVYVYTLTANGCSNTQNVTVTVNPRPAITPITQAICSGETFTVSPVNGANDIVPAGTTFTWTVAPNGSVTGETNQATPQANISQLLTNSTTSVQTVVYTVTPTSGSCAGTPFTVTITVKPTPTVNAVSNQTLCNGLNTNAVNFTGNAVAGKVYTWTNDTPSIGLAASGTGNIPSFTSTNTGAAPVTATITVTPVANGCPGTPRNFTITVNPSPVVTLLADYCAVGGRVRLIASSNIPVTWAWSTSPSTSSTIDVDLAGSFTVTATSTAGCVTTATISVAQELVIDGSFTNFDPNNISFTTGNIYVANNPLVTNELTPEGLYGVGQSARDYHPNFWGIDHTNNAVGPRNLMIFNTLLPSTTVWQQEVNVQPNTEYYFSGWAMSINNASPFAELIFAVNGDELGISAALPTGPTNATEVNNNIYWRRFYGSWNSGAISGNINISIVNLQGSLSGNDFALDDISFGTLSTFLRLTSAVGTDSQTVCQNSPLTDITYTAGSGIAGPTVIGLPPGITTSWNGVTLRFNGSPTTAAIGTYNYTVSTTGNCVPAIATGTITVIPIHTITAGSNQTVCQNASIANITMTLGGGATGATVTGLPTGLTSSASGNTLTISGTPTVSGPFNYTVTTTGNTCATATATGTITVSPIHTITVGSNQTVCQNAAMGNITMTLGGGATGATVTGLPTGVNSSVSGTTLTISGTPTVSGPFNYTVTTTGNACTIATTNGTITVTPLNTVVAGTNQTVCINSAITTVTLATTGATGAIVTGLPAGVTGTWAGNVVTISGIPTASGSFNYTVTTTGGCLPATTTGTIIVTPNNTVTASTQQAVCINTSLSPTITHTTTGATGIVPQGGGVSYNLPNGVTASWNAGVLTISGTPTEEGIFNYSIPLTGGCGSVSATGTITISNPSYPISSISVVNPPFGTPPYTSTFTVFSPGFTLGTYTLIYSTSGINQVANQTLTATVTTAGQLTFSSLPYTTEGTTLLTILSIQKSTDLCPYFPSNNTATYGINCSSEYFKVNGEATFYVPTNVSEVTIQVFGDGLGGNTDSETMNVLPAGIIFIVFDGTDVFATEVSPTEPIAVRLAQAIVSTTGPNGRIVITYDCSTLPPCASVQDNGTQYTDSEGYTILRFDFAGPCAWAAPDGLDEFEVLVVGGGGGGGFGEAAGGGGGGAVVYQQYQGITMSGLPGLQGASFPLFVGDQGPGATTATQGGNGVASTFTGPDFDFSGGNSFVALTAAGGGGAGSSSANPTIRQGADGASGGGGAASGTDESAGGNGNVGTSGGDGIGETFGSSGAGGGGFSGLGLSGTYTAGNGTMAGGTGGMGEERTISGEAIYYGAGGGGTSSGATTNQSGIGGSSYLGSNGAQFYSGGSGTNNGFGQLATTYGSGGGAGRLGGSSGFPGVVYIRYPNFRILPVEYLYFNAKYNSFERAGDLTWATAKEWENDRFEIERSVNNVKEWEAISEVDGAGYSDKEVKYDYSDIKLPVAGGNIFYRLKQYDFDGDFTYSDTKSIKVEALPGTTHWRVFPNPTTGTPFNIDILDPSAYQDEPITLRIISATGQFETIQVSEMKQMGAQVSDWFTTRASGIYTIEIIWGAQREYHKVILRR